MFPILDTNGRKDPYGIGVKEMQEKFQKKINEYIKTIPKPKIKIKSHNSKDQLTAENLQTFINYYNSNE